MTAPQSLDPALRRIAAEVEAALGDLLPTVEGGEARLCEAMRYATLGGGKRMRAFLVMETAALFSVDRHCAARVAAAVEMIHTYSLIHDDLPAMDDDDLRRGMPTVHKQFNEAVALLAGDTLLTFAFEKIAAAPLPPAQVVEIMGIVTRCIGKEDGPRQALTWNSRAGAIAIHCLKTAELIKACCWRRRRRRLLDPNGASDRPASPWVWLPVGRRPVDVTGDEKEETAQDGKPGPNASWFWPRGASVDGYREAGGRIACWAFPALPP
jgi:hypothetical protein